MTWDELKEEAKKMGAKIYISPYDDFERIDFKNVYLNKNGQIAVQDENLAMLSEDRTTDQMLAIMKALQ